MQRQPKTEHLTYRLYQENDLSDLLRLWEEETDWGTLTPDTWQQWYVDTPYEPCLIVVAVDEKGDIVGQEVFTPSRVIVGERQIQALRLSAPILRKNLRRVSIGSMNHPVIGLYIAGMNAAVERGYSLVYALPESTWLPFFQRLQRFADMDILSFASKKNFYAEYPCVASPIAPALPDYSGDQGKFSARLVTDFSIEYEALWQSARNTFPITCGVVRHPTWLRYKNTGHLALEIRDPRNTLIGYSVTKKKTCLLVDILARRPADLTPVLGTTLNWLASEQGDITKGGMDCLKVMETPMLRPALQALGFAPIDYKFAFVCAPLDSCLPVEAISPERWYITPGDGVA